MKKRPHLNEFLENMDRYFNLVLYTASLKEYADPIVDHIDPKGLIGQRYYREVILMVITYSIVKI